MIVCQIEDAQKFGTLSEGIALAIEWLQNHKADEFVKGIYAAGSTAAGDVIVKCEEPALMPRENVRLEAHRRFIDIHVPLKGTEIIGWAPVAALKHPQVPYCEESDVEFYGDAAHSLIHLHKGQLAVFFPEDAHAPNIGLGNHRKLCIKIPVS